MAHDEKHSESFGEWLASFGLGDYKQRLIGAGFTRKSAFGGVPSKEGFVDLIKESIGVDLPGHVGLFGSAYDHSLNLQIGGNGANSGNGGNLLTELTHVKFELKETKRKMKETKRKMKEAKKSRNRWRTLAYKVYGYDKNELQVAKEHDEKDNMEKREAETQIHTQQLQHNRGERAKTIEEMKIEVQTLQTEGRTVSTLNGLATIAYATMLVMVILSFSFGADFGSGYVIQCVIYAISLAIWGWIKWRRESAVNFINGVCCDDCLGKCGAQLGCDEWCRKRSTHCCRICPCAKLEVKKSIQWRINKIRGALFQAVAAPMVFVGVIECSSAVTFIFRLIALLFSTVLYCSSIWKWWNDCCFTFTGGYCCKENPATQVMNDIQQMHDNDLSLALEVGQGSKESKGPKGPKGSKGSKGSKESEHSKVRDVVVPADSIAANGLKSNDSSEKSSEGYNFGVGGTIRGVAESDDSNTVALTNDRRHSGSRQKVLHLDTKAIQFEATEKEDIGYNALFGTEDSDSE